MGIRVIAGMGARLLRRIAARKTKQGPSQGPRNSSRRFKTSRRKYNMYRSIWS